MFAHFYPGTHPVDLRGYSLREIDRYLTWARKQAAARARAQEG